MEGQDYKIPLGLDIKEASKNIQTLKTQLSALNKEAQTVGNNINRSFNTASGSANKLANIVVQNANAFKGASDQAKIFDTTLKSINTSINTVNSNEIKVTNISNGLSRANVAGGGFAGTLLRIGGLLGTVFGVAQIGQFAGELIDLAKKSEGVTRAFARLEGESSSNLQTLRESVKNTVDDLTLMQLAVRADNFKIPLDVLAKGLAFAQQRAIDTGQSVDYLVNSFVDGIGRKSTLVLDNLGISASELQEEVRRVGDFTEAVGNIIERSMNDSSTYVDDFGSRVNRLSTAWENAKLKMSQFTADLLTELTDIVTSDTWKEFWNRITSFGDGRNITQAKNLAKVYKEVGDALGSSRQLTSDLEIVQRVNSGQSYSSILAEAEKFYKKMSQAQTEYEAGVIAGNIKEEKATVEHYKQMEQRAKQNLEVVKRVGKDFNLNAPKVQFQIDTESIEMLDKKLEDLVLKRKSSQNLKEIDRYNKEIKALEKQIDNLQGKEDKELKRSQSKLESARKKQEREEEKANNRKKQVDAERVRIENEALKNQVDLIEDKVTKAVAKETTESQSRVRILEQRKVEFPELVKEINALIESEEIASQARVTAIIEKGQEEDKKAIKKSQQDIRKILKSETQIRIDDIEANYEQIIEEAKKAGTYSKDVEVQLERQKQKEISSVTLEGKLKSIERQEQIALNGVYQIKRKQGQSEERFERENQRKVLEVFIQFAEMKLNLLKSDPTKIEEVNELTEAIRRAKSEMKDITSDQSEDLFEWLGLDEEKIKKWSDRVSMAGDIFSDLFSGIADGAKANVEKIQEEISAIDDLIGKQEEAVEREKELKDKGLANNFANAQAELEFQKRNRDQLIKQEEEAQRRLITLRKAEEISDAVSQTSNLITASTQIFKTFSKIPIVGIPLAIGMIGTMFGAFAIAKANAIKNTKYEKGGAIGGKRHSQGGNKFVSVDGNSMIEHEEGEFVINRTSTSKHIKMIEAINKDDFSNISINDISLKSLLDGTGVTQSLEIAQKAGENGVTLINEKRSIEINSDSKMEEVNSTLKKILQHQKEKPDVYDFGDYYEIRKGNKIERFKK